jgi:hypothetical protein
MAVTGMRISEALALRFEDVTAEGLRIRHAKFQKSKKAAYWCCIPVHRRDWSAICNDDVAKVATTIMCSSRSAIVSFTIKRFEIPSKH